MIRIFKKHLDDHSEQVQRYGLIGVLTAIVGLASFWLMQSAFGMNANAANVISVLSAVVFGYIANKLVVFRSETQSLKSFFQEMGRFFLSRTVTILLEIACFTALLKLIGDYELLIRGAVSGVVFISNYIVSHLFVFDRATGQ